VLDPEVHRSLIKAEDWLSLAVPAGVEHQHVLRPADELLIDLGYAPNFFRQGFSSCLARTIRNCLVPDALDDPAPPGLAPRQSGKKRRPSITRTSRPGRRRDSTLFSRFIQAPLRDPQAKFPPADAAAISPSHQPTNGVQT
jgi:hypothetical protein